MNISLGGSACVSFKISVFDIWPAVVLIPLPSPQIRRHSQHIRNSAQLSWDHWNHRRGFLTKFAAQRILSTVSLMEGGGGERNKDRGHRETSEYQIDEKRGKNVGINTPGFVRGDQTERLWWHLTMFLSVVSGCFLWLLLTWECLYPSAWLIHRHSCQLWALRMFPLDQTKQQQKKENYQKHDKKKKIQHPS